MFFKIVAFNYAGMRMLGCCVLPVSLLGIHVFSEQANSLPSSNIRSQN